MSENLIEALQKEIKRNKRLLEIYESIGPAGLFVRSMIGRDVANAEAAIAEGDTVAMVRMLTALRNNSE